VEVVAIDRSVQPPSFAIRAEGREGKTEAHRLSLDPSWGGKMMNVTVKVTENDSGRPVSDSRRNTSTPTGQTSQQSLLCEISYDMPADCGMMNPDLPVAMGGGNVPFLGPFLGQMVSGFGGGLEMGFGGGGSMGSAGHAQRYPLVQAPPSVYEQYLQKEREWGSAAAAQAGLNRQGHGSAFECFSACPLECPSGLWSGTEWDCCPVPFVTQQQHAAMDCDGGAQSQYRSLDVHLYPRGC
jgi:hypothetical protein